MVRKYLCTYFRLLLIFTSFNILKGFNIDSVDINGVLAEIPPLINETDLHISQVSLLVIRTACHS